jgi:hypothetical protein
MSMELLKRARLLCCHAQVFAKAPYTEYDALGVWYAARVVMPEAAAAN